MARTIQSPGVEIREVDFTIRPVTVEGTSVFLAGFANQGPIDEVLQPGSVTEFEQIYGAPTNSAEQYFYQTAKAILGSSPARLLTTRVPYGSSRGEGFENWKYSALVYPASGLFTTYNATTSSLETSATGLSVANAYFFGKPTHLELSAEQYQQILDNNIDWVNNIDGLTANDYLSTGFKYNQLGNAGMIILNKAQTTVNNAFEGYYIGVIDNNNYNPATPFNGILSVNGVQSSDSTIHSYVSVPPARLNFSLSATKTGDGSSVSEVMENLGQVDLDSKSFDDTISLGVFKLRRSIYTPDTISLDYVLAESFVGSLDYHRQIADQTGGPANTFYIGELAESSANIKLMVNPYISSRFNGTWVNNDGVPSKKVRFLSTQLITKFNGAGFVDTDDTYAARVGATFDSVTAVAAAMSKTDSLFTAGIYSNEVINNKDIGGLPAKLERAFELVENADIYPINLAVEGGLGTVYVNAIYQSGDPATAAPSLSAGTFVDSKPLNAVSGLYVTNAEGLGTDATNLRSYYNSVANVFVNAAEKQRKDFMVILDPLRNIFVQGSNSKIISSKKIWSPNAGGTTPTDGGYVTTNFGQHIFWPLRHQFSTINSSYATTYGQFAQVIDSNTNRQIWVPFSGFAAAIMANTDQNFQPWFAPAGFARGIVTGTTDLAVYPKQKQRDQLYKMSINPVAFFPAEGFVVFGQKTLLKKPSAFDRINVRRLFLNLETAVRDTIKFFVFEPNTFFTRTRIVNTLSPIFDRAKNTEGLYDYLIVCDERNNTPDVIDANELKVDIYIKPVRTAEFILVSFYATRTGQNFQELIGA